MGHWKSRCLVNKVDQSELSSQAVNSFCLVIKETCSLTFSWSKIVVFSWLILDNFECLLSVGLNGNRTCWNELSGFPEGAHNRGLLSNSTIHTSLSWEKTTLWCGWWWFILLAPWSLPFHIIVQYPLFTAYHCFNNIFIMFK